MPRSDNPQSQNPENGSAPAPSGAPSGTAPAEPARTLYSAGLKFGADDPVPEYLKNKSPQEIVALVQSMERALATASPAPAPAPQPAPQSAAPQAQPQFADPYADSNEYARQVSEWATRQAIERMTAMAAPVFDSTAQLSRSQSQLDPELGTVWRRWGPEVDALVSAIPSAQRSKAVYDQAAGIVRGQHWRELVADEAARQAQPAAAATERAGTTGAPTGVSFGDKLSTLWTENGPYVQWARREGVTESAMREFARKSGRTPDQYAEDIMRSQTIHAGAMTPSERGTPKVQSA